MTYLEKKICDKLKVSYGVFTGNGTTAMYLAFKALGMQEKKVLFPAISCTNPVNAAIFAGYEVEFCDVCLADYTMDVVQLENMLQTGEYGIIVPTHIYGHRYAQEEINRIAKKYQVLVFEDAAQSYYLGNADVAVMSFGHTKACETPLGGGVALTNSKELEEKMRYEKERLVPLDGSAIEAFDQYREEYYDIVRKSPDWSIRNQRLRELQQQSWKYFIYDLDENDQIILSLNRLKEVVQLREEKVKLYEERLNNQYIIKANTKNMFRWRYTFLYRGDRDFLLNQARNRKIDISSWYFSLAGIYQGKHLKNADKVEKQVVNLWVDESHSSEQICKEIKILNEIMEEDYGRIK